MDWFMKKIIIFVSLLILPFSMLFAHPPTEMKCELNAVNSNRSELTSDKVALFIGHNVAQSAVKDRNIHFIKTITIKVNGKLTDTFSYTIQRQNILRHIERISKVKSGDKVVITATCSIGGEMTQEIIVPQPVRLQRGRR